MIIGRLKHRIEIQRKEEIQDPNSGSLSEKWITVGKSWAEIKGISGNEFIAANAQQSGITWRLIIRYRKISQRERILYQDNIFNIKAVLPDNDRKMMVLMCETGVNDG